MGGDRLGLALDEERFEWFAEEDRPRVADDGCNGDHVAVCGLAEHASSGVHGVAHEGVGTSELAAEEAGEHSAGLHSLAKHEGRLDLSQFECCMEHGVAGVTAVDRRAGAEHELDAVTGDVGVERSDAVRLTDPHDVVHEIVERHRHRLGTVVLEQCSARRRP